MCIRDSIYSDDILFMIGIMLAVGYIFIFKSKLPGTDILKGIIYGLMPLLMARVLVMPMMFSTNTGAPSMMVMGSLIGHVYGAVLGETIHE